MIMYRRIPPGTNKIFSYTDDEHIFELSEKVNIFQQSIHCIVDSVLNGKKWNIRLRRYSHLIFTLGSITINQLIESNIWMKTHDISHQFVHLKFYCFTENHWKNLSLKSSTLMFMRTQTCITQTHKLSIAFFFFNYKNR